MCRAPLPGRHAAIMLIEAEDLHKSFASLHAVRGISLCVARGERVAVLGANGAGKSTTLRMLAGALSPDAGRARIAGADITAEPLAARAAVGYLPEAANGFSNLSVAEFLSFSAHARGLYGTRYRQAISHAVDILDLAPAFARPLGTLSKGWRQRAWLAQALIHDPPVLILDEPTDGLDPTQKIALRTRLTELSREKAMIISTHILEEAETLCDRVVVITGGRVLADAKISELVDDAGRLAATFARLTADGGEGAGGTAA